MIINFYPNRPKYCRQSLRRLNQNEEINLSTLFAFGFFAGFAVVLIFIIVFIKIEGYLGVDIKSNVFRVIFPCFRGPALILLFYWFMAIDVWCWNEFRINYKIYLGFNHHFSTLTEILKRNCVLSSIYLSMFFLYIL